MKKNVFFSIFHLLIQNSQLWRIGALIQYIINIKNAINKAKISRM